MKKVILLAIACLAYVSVQAQSAASPEQVKKVIDTKLQTITSKVDFSETQTAFLKDYVAFKVKSKTRGFQKEAKAMQMKDVNMDTFFTEEQRIVIQKELMKIPSVAVPSKTLVVEENSSSTWF